MITVKKNFITKLFAGGAASSLKYGALMMLNDSKVSAYDNKAAAISRGFCESDIVYSIISKKATTGARAPFGVYKIKSLSKAKQYKQYLTQKDIKLSELKVLKESAIEPIKNHYLNDVYDSPNPGMSGTEYTEGCLIYLNTTGDNFEQAIPRTKRGKEIAQFYLMPADLTVIKTDGSYPILPTGYNLQAIKDFNFELSEVIHSKYFNPNWDASGSHLYGLSPIQVGWNLINGDNEGWDALWQIKKNRGAQYIVGIESDAIKSYADAMPQMERLKDEFTRRNREFKDRVMPIAGKITGLNVGMSAVDLEVLQTSQLTFDRLCNIYHVPVEWFNTDKQSKYNNLEQFNKQAIINGVIPDLNKLRDARNMWARANGIISDSEMIDYDPTVFTELDVDKEAVWKAIKDAPFKKDEQRVLLGETPLGTPAMDQVYINRNQISIDKVNDLTNEQASQGANAAGNQRDQGEEGGDN